VPKEVELVMNAVEQFGQVLTGSQSQELVDFESSSGVEPASSTQQLLDELLGRFEDDDSPMFPVHALTPEFCFDFVE
jgi:hypothetical protein